MADLKSATESLPLAHARHLHVVSQIIATGRELAMTQAHEKAKRIEVFESSRETSVSARDREADAHLANVIDEVIRMKGDLAAYSEERDYLRFLIEHWSENAELDELHPAAS